MVPGGCIVVVVQELRKSSWVRIMTCPDVVAMCMHPLLLKACFLLDMILFGSFYFYP